MEKFVSSWCDGKALPESYVLSPEARPGEHTFSASKTIPVIDLGITPQQHVIQHIMDAGRDYGAFQVINHGVSRRLMDNVRGVFDEFFNLPNEEKVAYCDENSRKCKLLTSAGDYYDMEKVHFWRDFLVHPCHDPLEESMQNWPNKPTNYRDIVREYLTEVNKLSSRILELISEGSGITAGHFGKELTVRKTFSISLYPPCPNPSLTLGLGKHSDPSILTILIQGNVEGLQISKAGEWFDVEPILDAIVVFVGDFLEVVTNGKLKPGEHRVMTNSKEARTSGGFFISPASDCIVEPAKALINANNPPLFKPVHCMEHTLRKTRARGMKA